MIEEQLTDGSLAEPIFAFVHQSPAAAVSNMEFGLTAAAKVTFRGARYLHGYLSHKFSAHSSADSSRLTLVAQARQFSSFIVLIGRIASSKVFDPKFAFIVQNKDDIKIPLNQERIPTAQEFQDAIESLSPEQQRFATAFRSMQLESTMFGVLVIQIKPQMEKVKNNC